MIAPSIHSYDEMPKACRDLDLGAEMTAAEADAELCAWWDELEGWARRYHYERSLDDDDRAVIDAHEARKADVA